MLLLALRSFLKFLLHVLPWLIVAALGRALFVQGQVRLVLRSQWCQETLRNASIDRP